MDIEKTPEQKKYEEELAEKAKTVIRGDDVIHLNYLKPLIDEQTLRELKEELSTVNLRLSSWDDTNVIKASLEDFSLQVYLVVGNPITIEILKTIGLNSVWEVIKYSIVKLHSKIFNSTSPKSQEISKQINFGFRMDLDDQNSFEFKLDGDFEEEVILKIIDKSLDFVEKHSKQNTTVSQFPLYSTYDKTENRWKKHDIIEEIKKQQKKK